MPISLPFRGVFVASAAAVACFATLLTLVKSALGSECAGAGGGSSLRAAITACLVAAAASLVSSAACLLKSRALSWALAAAICSKWQPVYFVFVTVQRMVLRAMVTHAAIYDAVVLAACDEHQTAASALSWMWLCSISASALSAMSCDMNAEASPALRRCGYGLLAFVLLLDAIGSVVWGNALASNISISIVNISVILDSQITSCIMSQVVIALHFLYVSCRSLHGRGWAYASLRFELDERGSVVSMPMLPATADCRKDSARAVSLATPMLAMPMLPSEQSSPAESQRAGTASSSLLFRWRVRWLGFQQQRVSRCRVFVIPCVAVRDAGGSGDGFAVARPVFDMIWLRPLL
jgi:hypothetical protein